MGDGCWGILGLFFFNFGIVFDVSVELVFENKWAVKFYIVMMHEKNNSFRFNLIV